MAGRPNVEDVFEAWAHVAARLRKRPAEEQRAILADLGIGAEWGMVHESWSRRLNEDISAQRMDRPEQYARICREEQERRRRARPAPGARVVPPTQPGAPATLPGDFRAALMPGVAPTPPSRSQPDTAPGIGVEETVLAARQADEVASWPVERWAHFCAALEREPRRSTELWHAQGVTSTAAREHAQRHWQRRLGSNPRLQSELLAILTVLRGG